MPVETESLVRGVGLDARNLVTVLAEFHEACIRLWQSQEWSRDVYDGVDRELELRTGIQRIEKDGEVAGNGCTCKWHVDHVDVLPAVSSSLLGRVEYTATVTVIFAVESLAQFKHVRHEGVRLFGSTLENARLLQARKFVFVHVFVLHGEKRVGTCALVFGIRDSCDFDHLLGDNHYHGGIQLGPVHPRCVGSGGVLDRGLALAHLGEVQVVAFEQVERCRRVAHIDVSAAASALMVGYVAFRRM